MTPEQLKVKLESKFKFTIIHPEPLYDIKFEDGVFYSENDVVADYEIIAEQIPKHYSMLFTNYRKLPHHTPIPPPFNDFKNVKIEIEGDPNFPIILNYSPNIAINLVMKGVDIRMNYFNEELQGELLDCVELKYKEKFIAAYNKMVDALNKYQMEVRERFPNFIVDKVLKLNCHKGTFSDSVNIPKHFPDIVGEDEVRISKEIKGYISNILHKYKEHL